MADYNTSKKKTGRNEGKYANASGDSGGETWAGISRHNFPHWSGWSRIDAAKAKLGIAFAVDLASHVREALDAVLSADSELADMVDTFYKTEFWAPLQLDSEPDQLLADEVYDTAVNMGVPAAKAILQKARGA